jgi:hypothetical protein
MRGRLHRNPQEGARVDHSAYVKALATELKALVCSGGDDAIHILCGLLKKSKDCQVSASLTDADKGSLLQIKRDAIKEAGQQPKRAANRG